MTETETLRTLLRAAQDKHGGISGRALADLAVQHGHQIDRTQVNAILAGTYKHRPSLKTIQAVAFLAGVPVDVAFVAAGVAPPMAPFAEALHADADYLTDPERKVINDLIAVMTRGRALAEQEQDAQRDVRDIIVSLTAAGEFSNDALTNSSEYKRWVEATEKLDDEVYEQEGPPWRPTQDDEEVSQAVRRAIEKVQPQEPHKTRIADEA